MIYLLIHNRPQCSEYVAVIQRYCETRRAYGWGLVCQALAGAMRHVLQASQRSAGLRGRASASARRGLEAA